MSAPTPTVFSPRDARYALATLFAINLFNYIDRQIISGVLALVQRDLEVSDAALGALGSAFMVLYLLGSIPLGILGDRVPRHRLIAVGIAVWGAATFLSGLARSYVQLFATRALVGIGEASYGPTATAMVSDLFPKARRGLVNALFNAAIPIGGAIGVIVGGVVGTQLRLARGVPPRRAAEPRPRASWPGVSATRPAGATTCSRPTAPWRWSRCCPAPPSRPGS